MCAPDLIGMGNSDKLKRFTRNLHFFIEHRKWLNELLNLLNMGNNVVLVVHDWGSALGLIGQTEIKTGCWHCLYGRYCSSSEME